MHPDSELPNDEQRKQLGDMLHCALVEIRTLGWRGHAKQAAALADAFHNLPQEMWREHFSVGHFRHAFLEPYLRDWPRGPYDYMDMLRKVEQMR